MVRVARKILEWAREKQLRLWWGRGKQDGSFFPMLDHKGQAHYSVAVWTYGTIEIQFQQMKKMAPFSDEAKRSELLRRINAVPGIQLQDDAIGRRPNVRLNALADTSTLDAFLEVLNWYVDEVRAT